MPAQCADMDRAVVVDPLISEIGYLVDVDQHLG
jgi:hypothetical protein